MPPRSKILPGDALQTLAVGEVVHDRVPAGEVDGIEVGRIDPLRGGRVLEEGHAGGVGTPSSG